MAREVFRQAVTLLRNGLAFDDLDEHDAGAVSLGRRRIRLLRTSMRLFQQHAE